MKRWLTIAFLISLIGVGNGQNQEPIANVELSTSVIKLGEQINMELTLSTFVADTVEWPIIGDTLISEIEVLDRSKIDTVINQDNVEEKVYRQTFVLTSFDSGYYELSPISFIVNGERVQTSPFLIEVQTLAVEEGKGLKDIKGPMQDDLTLADYAKLYWPYLLGGIILVLLILLAVHYWKREKPQLSQLIPTKPKDPPHVIAFKKLEALKAEKLWQNNQEKEFHTRLSEILREYLEARFGILALEQSSVEILEQFEGAGYLNKEQFADLRGFLQFTDLVKFAKQKPLPDENTAYFDLAEKLIKGTIPAEESEQNNEEKTTNSTQAKTEQVKKEVKDV